MVLLKSTFDGQRIELPEELRGAAPGEILILYSGAKETVLAPRVPANAKAPSIWDVFGKAPVRRTAEDIDRQIREERDSWGDR